MAGPPDNSNTLILFALRDHLRQIEEALSGERNLGSFHIISHGSGGTLYLDNDVVDHSRLSALRGALDRIAAALGAGADILLCGCNVLAMATGETFIEALAKQPTPMSPPREM